MMVGDNRKYNVALVTLMSEGATGELPGTDKLAGVALEVGHLQTKSFREDIVTIVTTPDGR